MSLGIICRLTQGFYCVNGLFKAHAQKQSEVAVLTHAARICTYYKSTYSWYVCTAVVGFPHLREKFNPACRFASHMQLATVLFGIAYIIVNI
jgi:hypothetical protein